MSNNYHLDTLEKCNKKLYRLRFEIKQLKQELAAAEEEAKYWKYQKCKGIIQEI